MNCGSSSRLSLRSHLPTRVFGDLEHRAGLLVEFLEVCQLLLGVHAHAAELQHLELAAVFAHASLLEEHGALGVVDFHQDGDDDEQPAQQNQNRGAECEVENSLHKAVGDSVIGPRYGFVPKFRLQPLGALKAFTTTFLHVEIVDSAATHGLVTGRGFSGRRGFRHGHDVALFPASPRRFLCSCSFPGHYECATPSTGASNGAVAPAFSICVFVPNSLFTLLSFTFPYPKACLGLC